MTATSIWNCKCHKVPVAADYPCRAVALDYHMLLRGFARARTNRDGGFLVLKCDLPALRPFLSWRPRQLSSEAGSLIAGPTSWMRVT